MTHPPRDRVSLEAGAGEEAAGGAKLPGEEGRVGKDEGDEEEQGLDDGQEEPGPVQPEDARLEAVDVAPPRRVTRDPHQLGVDEEKHRPRNDYQNPSRPSFRTRLAIVRNSNSEPCQKVHSCECFW